MPSIVSKIVNLCVRSVQYAFRKPFFAEYHRSTVMDRQMRVQGRDRISLGPNVWIGKWGWLAADPNIGTADCALRIGAGSWIGDFAHIYASQALEIGNKVLIASNVFISDCTHKYEDPTLPVLDQGIRTLGKVRIGDGSWIGEGVSIQGASIGKNCVIGSHSVVSRDIPDYCVAVGAPARIVKRYDWENRLWRATDEQGNFIESTI